ncbi:MAG: CZB domain-containing protein [Myxococcales bacterium]|nr:CZB domain-containing protein [Myxococcales bacterium]
MSDVKDQIAKAIGTHGMWKARLQGAVSSGKSENPPEVVEKDDQCEFGKWLATLAMDPTVGQSHHYVEVRALHAKFHGCAAKVIRLAVKGDRASAGTLMDGEYADASAALTSAMMRWRAA